MPMPVSTDRRWRGIGWVNTARHWQVDMPMRMACSFFAATWTVLKA